MYWGAARQPNFIWNNHAIIGALTLAVAACSALWNLGAGNRGATKAE